MKKVVVIGAGAAGMIAAITAAQSGASVTLIEKNERPARRFLLPERGAATSQTAVSTKSSLKIL